MRYVIITLSNDYCGCDEVHCLMFPKGTPDSEISAYADELLNDYSASYEYLTEDSDEDIEMFYESCTFDWIEVFKGDDDFNSHIEEFSMA